MRARPLAAGLPRPSKAVPLAAAVAALLLLGTDASGDPVAGRRAPASVPQPQLVITTTGALPDTTARDAAGPPPSEPSELEPWARYAADRVVEAYKAKGYPYARTWYRIGRDRTVRLYLDEGKVRVGFTGAGSVQGFLLRQNLNLPHGVVHEPSLRRALDGIRRGYDLLNIYYRVKEPGEMEITPLGDTVPQRVLQIYVVSREDYGWSFDLGFSSTWGVLPGVAYQRKLFWPGDRFRGKIELGFPFRRYLFEEAPSFQWVHGGMELRYQTPHFWHRRLAPRFEELLYVSHLDREDLQIRSYFRLRSTSLPSLVLFVHPFELSLGLGADVIRVFEVDLKPAANPAELHLGDNSSVRLLSRLKLRLEPSSEAMRRDQRHFAEVRFDVVSSDAQSWLVDAEVTAQVFFLFGRHRLVIHPRGVLLAGAVRFWDEVPLAGDWQRVWFDNRYWVHRALQLELGYRLNVWSDWVDVGVFHDASVFDDRTQPGQPAAAANAFGPSLHLLLFDTFAVDMYYGFGFAPAGFNHGISFSVSNTF